MARRESDGKMALDEEDGRLPESIRNPEGHDAKDMGAKLEDLGGREHDSSPLKPLTASKEDDEMEMDDLMTVEKPLVSNMAEEGHSKPQRKAKEECIKGLGKFTTKTHKQTEYETSEQTEPAVSLKAASPKLKLGAAPRSKAEIVPRQKSAQSITASKQTSHQETEIVVHRISPTNTHSYSSNQSSSNHNH